jgi:hypothetical protein
MKFSRLSTIQFTDNDFQSKSPLDMPIVPSGEVLTFMELEEGFDISLFTSYPSIPAYIDIVNVRTGKRTAISNTTSAPCTFSGIVPKSLRPGIYRVEFLVRQKQRAVSAPFRVIADNEWGAIVGNNYAERYTDGTPSIVGGRLVQFVQYFRRKDFRLAAVENNTFYDDERGTSFSLQDKNYARHHLEGYAGERTIAAISMLLAGSWSMLTYYDQNGNKNIFRLQKSGDISTEVVGRGFCQFSGDFNARRQNQIAVAWNEAAEEWGVDFASPKNLIVRNFGQLTHKRVPEAVFCLPFSNVEIELKDGSLFSFDTSSHFSRLTFTSGNIPDNFGRSLKRLWVDAIRQGDKVTHIGNNANLANGSTEISADFPSLHTIGRNVTIGNFNGSLRFSNNAVFDNLTIKAPTPPAIFCKNAIFKNCKLNNYNIVGTVAELHNVELRLATFNSGIISDDALLVGCKFVYDNGSYIFSKQRLVDCYMVEMYDPNTVFDLSKYNGSMVNSFTYQRLSIATDASTSKFAIDDKSLHGYIHDSGSYLASIQRKDGRDIDSAGYRSIDYTQIDTQLAYDYDPANGNLLTMDGSMVSRGTPTYIAIGAKTPADLLSAITFGAALTFTIRGDLGGSNLNNVVSNGSTATIAASDLLRLLQSGGKYLNNVDFTLQVDNDLPSGFSYLLFKTNPNVLQNLTLTVNVSNDLNGELVARLSELYPNFTINSI